MEWQRDTFRLTDDPALIDHDVVLQFLQRESYWAQDLPEEVIRTSLAHSVCFSLLDGTQQIGFARVITDHAVFGYLEDVFVNDDYRGSGLGVWLVSCVLEHPVVSKLKKMMLATADAQTLYAKFGFTPLGRPEMVMERYNTERFSQFSDTM